MFLLIIYQKKEYAAEVYTSENGGESWRETHEAELLIFPGIGWYFTDIYVSPDNDNEIYALGVRADTVMMVVKL